MELNINLGDLKRFRGIFGTKALQNVIKISQKAYGFGIKIDQNIELISRKSGDKLDIFKGYIRTKGKKPIESYRNKKQFYTYDYIRKTDGDYGAILADDMVQIDIDGLEESEIVKAIVIDLNLKCAILRTSRGYHFYFRNTDLSKRQIKMKTPIGVTIDVGIGAQNAPVPIKVDGKTRRWLNRFDNTEDIDFLPDWLRPMKGSAKEIPDFKELAEGDGRNQVLFNYILTLQSKGFSTESIKKTISLINKYVLRTPMDQKEVDTILRDEAFQKQSFYDKSKFLHD